MKRFLTVTLLAVALLATAISPALAGTPAPGPGFGDHVSMMAPDCTCKFDTFGLHIAAMATGQCGCMEGTMMEGCTCTSHN